MTDWPTRTITVRTRNLPHWSVGDGTYFVTFRLADALTPAEAWHIRQQQRRGFDAFLDRGRGSCWLLDDRIAAIIADAMTHFDESRYVLHAWTLMPNHVHVALRTARGFSLGNVLHCWKSFTANEANKVLNRSGTFWQDESYDCLLHDQNDLDRVITYIEENPRVAGLRDWRWTAVVRTEFSFQEGGTGWKPVPHGGDRGVFDPGRGHRLEACATRGDRGVFDPGRGHRLEACATRGESKCGENKCGESKSGESK